MKQGAWIERSPRYKEVKAKKQLLIAVIGVRKMRIAEMQ